VRDSGRFLALSLAIPTHVERSCRTAYVELTEEEAAGMLEASGCTEPGLDELAPIGLDTLGLRLPRQAHGKPSIDTS